LQEHADDQVLITHELCVQRGQPRVGVGSHAPPASGGERGRAAKCGGGRAARPALCSPKNGRARCNNSGKVRTAAPASPPPRASSCSTATRAWRGTHPPRPPPRQPPRACAPCALRAKKKMGGRAREEAAKARGVGTHRGEGGERLRIVPSHRLVGRGSYELRSSSLHRTCCGMK
jgi:hypothetical protein